jgi:hypothetical protein
MASETSLKIHQLSPAVSDDNKFMGAPLQSAPFQDPAFKVEVAEKAEEFGLANKAEVLAEQPGGLLADKREGFLDKREGFLDQREGFLADKREGFLADKREGFLADQREGFLADKREGFLQEGQPVVDVVVFNVTVEEKAPTLATKDAMVQGAVAAKDTMLEKTAAAKDVALAAKDTMVEKTVAAKDAMVEGAAAAKDTMLEKTAAAKDVALAAKDTMLEKTVAAKDTMLEKTVAAKDTMVEGAFAAKDNVIAAKDTMVERTIAAKDAVVEKTIAAKDSVVAAKDVVVEKAFAAKDIVVEKAVAAKDFVADKVGAAQHAVAGAADTVGETVAHVQAVAGPIGESIKQEAIHLKEVCSKAMTGASAALHEHAKSTAETLREKQEGMEQERVELAASTTETEERGAEFAAGGMARTPAMEQPREVVMEQPREVVMEQPREVVFVVRPTETAAISGTARTDFAAGGIRQRQSPMPYCHNVHCIEYAPCPVHDGAGASADLARTAVNATQIDAGALVQKVKDVARPVKDALVGATAAAAEAARPVKGVLVGATAAAAEKIADVTANSKIQYEEQQRMEEQQRTDVQFGASLSNSKVQYEERTDADRFGQASS